MGHRVGDVSIRMCHDDDLEAVAEIYAPFVTDTVITFELEVPSVDEWRSRFRVITDAGLPFLIAEIDGGVVGYAYCAPWRSRPAYRHSVEDSIYLAPRAQGHGLGGRLLDRLLDETRASAKREMIAVIADAGQPASAALHRSRGFDEVGRLRRVGHKHGRWVDTVLMQKSLID